MGTVQGGWYIPAVRSVLNNVSVRGTRIDMVQYGYCMPYVDRYGTGTRTHTK